MPLPIRLRAAARLLPYLPYAVRAWVWAGLETWRRRGFRLPGGARPTEPIGVVVPTQEGPVRGCLHPAGDGRAGLVAVGGSRGGMHGPAWIYDELCATLQAEGVTGLRLDYRRPNHLQACVQDVLAGVAWLAAQGVQRLVLVGWSFGGAVVIRAGAASDRVVGVATVASQTYGTEPVSRLAPRSLLLLHGTDDPVLPARCSHELYARAGAPKELRLFPGDGHGLERHRQQMLAALRSWSQRVLRGEEDGRGE